MASVKQFPGSRFWYACYKQPIGRLDAKGRPVFRHVQRSTKLTDKGQAHQLAISYERAAVAAAAQRWNENAAKRFLAEVSALTGAAVAQVEASDAFLLRWYNSHKGSWTGGTPARYKGIIDDFLAYLGLRKGAPLSDVSRAVVASFRDSERKAGKSAATVNKALMVLAQAFGEAVTIHAMEENPARGLNVASGKKSRQKRRAFSFEQFRDLVAKCSPDYMPPDRTTWKEHRLSADWQTFLLLLGYTGGRQQEVAKLRWNQIDLQKRRLTLERSKTVDEHWLPIHASLATHLEALPSRSGFVLPYIATLERRRVSNAFRLSILPRIGIRQEYAVTEGEGRKVAEYSIHSLRHSLATWLEAAGVDEKNRMDLIGHESEQVNRGYTHTELARLASELAKVPSL